MGPERGSVSNIQRTVKAATWTAQRYASPDYYPGQNLGAFSYVLTLLKPLSSLFLLCQPETHLRNSPVLALLYLSCRIRFLCSLAVLVYM